MARIFRRKLAVLIPAHNEELVVAATIQSAIKAGMNQRDIYVVNDASTDATARIARSLLGRGNVLSVRRSGKALATKKAISKFDLTNRYRWLHIADADGVFGRNYFKIFRKALRPEQYAAATGYVQSLQGGWVSKFRVYEYTWGLDVVRRIQSWFGVITVIPGPTSCLRTDIINDLNFETGSLTEDFDITLQLYRQRLGRIQFIPQAKTYTQDPQNLSDFIQQISRWYRGYFQGIKRHRVGTKPTRIDGYIGLTMLQTFYYGIMQFLFIPILAIVTGHYYMISLFFLYDLAIYFTLVVAMAGLSRRLDIISAFPLFYILRLANLLVFFKAFVEIMLLQKFRNGSSAWATEGRRYALATELAK